MTLVTTTTKPSLSPPSVDAALNRIGGDPMWAGLFLQASREANVYS